MSRIKTLARPRASALRAWLFVLPLMALIVAAWPAKAADIDELEDQIARIQRQMQDLQEEVYRNGGGAPGSSGGAYDASTNQRLNDMEQSLRTLTGQVEQLAFEVRSLREQMERLDREMQFRLGALESAAGIAPPVSGDGGSGGTTPDYPSGGGTLEIPGAGSGGGVSGGPTTLGPSGGGVLGEIPVSPPGTPAEAQYQSGMDLLSRAQYAQAQAQFRQLVAEYPDSEFAPDAQYFISDIYFVQGMNEEAARGFAEFVKNYPSARRGADAMLKLGLALFALGRNDDGCTILGAIRDKFPDASDAVTSRADREARKNGC
ncbi:MAG TPA: tol-pal system protein YbgF [Micropepsaceae bacterium]|nr:tol-pal system protein YbgF [Micropepsaceae bacterium]